MAHDLAASPPCILCQADLMPKIVVHDPLAPERSKRIHVEHEPVGVRLRQIATSRGGVELHPTFTGNVSLHPGVSFAGADDVLRRDVVKLAAREAVHNPRWHSQSSHHHCRGRSKVLAVSLAAHEKEIRNRILRNATWKLQGIAKVRTQIELDGRGFLFSGG